VRSGVTRYGEAMQIEVVSFLAFRPGASVDEARGSAQNWQQALADLRGQLTLQGDKILARSTDVGLPQQPVVVRICGFEGDQQIISLPQEVTCQDVSNMQLAADRLRIQILTNIFSCHRRGTNIQSTGVSKNIGEFVGQSKTQIVNAEIAIHVLERQHGDGVLGSAVGGASSMLVPPRTTGRQNRNQQGCHSYKKIGLSLARILKRIRDHAIGKFFAWPTAS